MTHRPLFCPPQEPISDEFFYGVVNRLAAALDLFSDARLGDDGAAAVVISARGVGQEDGFAVDATATLRPDQMLNVLTHS